IEPRCTSRCATSTAFRPPKARETPSTTRMGSGLATPGSAATPLNVSATPTGPHLVSVAQDALRSEHDQQHESHPHDRVAQRAEVGLVDETGGPGPGADRLPEERVEALQHEPE